MRINGTKHRAGVKLAVTWSKDRTPIMAIHTGLSVIVAGHLIELKRDEKRKTATVIVTSLNGRTATGTDAHALVVAADLLTERARRFFGRQWTVIQWNGKQGERSA